MAHRPKQTTRVVLSLVPYDESLIIDDIKSDTRKPSSKNRTGENSSAETKTDEDNKQSKLQMFQKGFCIKILTAVLKGEENKRSTSSVPRKRHQQT